MAAFIVVGGAGATVYVVIATVLGRAGVAAWLASGITYAVMIPIVYAAQHRFTFQTSTAHGVAFPRYLMIQFLGFTLAWAVPAMLSPPLAALPYVFALVSILAAGMSFLLMRYWAFPALDGEDQS